MVTTKVWRLRSNSAELAKGTAKYQYTNQWTHYSNKSITSEHFVHFLRFKADYGSDGIGWFKKCHAFIIRQICDELKEVDKNVPSE